MPSMSPAAAKAQCDAQSPVSLTDVTADLDTFFATSARQSKADGMVLMVQLLNWTIWPGENWWTGSSGSMPPGWPHATQSSSVIQSTRPLASLLSLW